MDEKKLEREKLTFNIRYDNEDFEKDPVLVWYHENMSTVKIVSIAISLLTYFLIVLGE